jgi:hypothetical protein
MDDERARYLAEVTRYNCEKGCVHLTVQPCGCGFCQFYGEELAWDEGTNGWWMCDECVDDTYGECGN